MRGSRRRSLGQSPNDLLVLGEAALALLGKDQRAVRDDVELALRARDRLRLVRRLLAQLGRETRSPSVIAVSDGAVVDLDLHPCTSLPNHATRTGPGSAFCAITRPRAAQSGSIANRGGLMSSNAVRPPIVLIHGMWMTPLSWEHWVNHYADRGYRVLAPAWPGL